MASATKRLVIDPNATYGQGVSINEPLSNLEEDYNQGRIRAKPGAADFPTLAERLQGRLGESSGISVRPSISRTPNVAPMPLGCPAGFYQQGDVCVPSVDLIPGEDKFPRIAGKVFPRGVIQDIIPPTHTNQGEFFYVQAKIVNDGSAEGKFFFRVTIPSLNVDTETEAVRVPPFQEALMYKRVRMPDHAPSIDDIEGEATISHFNEEEEHITDETKIIDDTTSFLIPGPTQGYSDIEPAREGGGYSGGNSGSSPRECFNMTLSRLYDISNTYDGVVFNDVDAIVSELNGRGLSLNNTSIQWCPTGRNNDLAVIIEGIPYLPTNMTSENDTRNAAITLTPHNAIRDGDPITVSGMNFAPHETIDIVLRVTTSAVDDQDDATIDEYEGQVFTKRTTVEADSGGDFRTTIRSQNFPSGVIGDGIVSATGVRSSKTSSKSIQIT